MKSASAVLANLDVGSKGVDTGDWASLRQPTDPSESTLSDRTIKWLATLPAEIRPMETGRQYPRIANRLSDLWPHCEYTRLYFQSLLVDRRGGRKGFPPLVRKELEVLQYYYFEKFSALPAILWNAVPVRPPKIPNRVFQRHPESLEIDILPP